MFKQHQDVLSDYFITKQKKGMVFLGERTKTQQNVIS